MHFLIFGLLLGLGAAIPIGPVNLEIIRRNLKDGTTLWNHVGIWSLCSRFNLCGDTLLRDFDTFSASRGVAYIKFGGFLCSSLVWYQNFTAKPASDRIQMTKPSHFRYGLEGYLITLIILTPFYFGLQLVHN